jgi:hypothetical protein
MTKLTGQGRKGFAASAATYLHAFVLLLALLTLPVDPFCESFENSIVIGVMDQGPDETVDKVDLTGGDPAWWNSSLLGLTDLRDGQKTTNGQDAPRGGCCGRAFHARGPPILVGPDVNRTRYVRITGAM